MRSCSKPTDSESLGVGPRNLDFIKLSPDEDYYNSFPVSNFYYNTLPSLTWHYGQSYTIEVLMVSLPVLPSLVFILYKIKSTKNVELKKRCTHLLHLSTQFCFQLDPSSKTEKSNWY